MNSNETKIWVLGVKFAHTHTHARIHTLSWKMSFISDKLIFKKKKKKTHIDNNNNNNNKNNNNKDNNNKK